MIIDKARLFATAAHGAIGQTRKYTGEPYIVHPAAVYDVVRSVPHDDAMLAAAWLHDVVEDTQIALGTVFDNFGSDVSGLVFWLTDRSTPADGNREKRKTLERERLAKASARAQTIKVADLIDNTSSIVMHDPKFAEVYLEEKRLLLDVLTKADPRLLSRARSQLMEVA